MVAYAARFPGRNLTGRLMIARSPTEGMTVAAMSPRFSGAVMPTPRVPWPAMVCGGEWGAIEPTAGIPESGEGVSRPLICRWPLPFRFRGGYSML